MTTQPPPGTDTGEDRFGTVEGGLPAPPEGAHPKLVKTARKLVREGTTDRTALRVELKGHINYGHRTPQKPQQRPHHR